MGKTLRVQQLITCNGTALAFLDSETHCKSVDVKMYHPPQVGYHTYVIFNKYLWITHLVSGLILGAIDTTVCKTGFVTILMKALFRQILHRSPLYLHKR